MKNHGYLKCFLVNFALGPDQPKNHLPGPLEPDIYRGRAFLAVVIAQLRNLRPRCITPVRADFAFLSRPRRFAGDGLQLDSVFSGGYIPYYWSPLKAVT